MSNILVKKLKTIAGMEYPKTTPDYVGYLTCARFYHVQRWLNEILGAKGASGKDLNLMSPNEAMERAIKELIPESDYKMSPWGSQIIAGFTGDADYKHDELVVQASASASKSQTMGLLMVLHFFTSPKDTTCRIISTDIKGLKQRAWAAVTQYFQILQAQGAPGVFSRQSLAIFNQDEKDENIASLDQKAGIFAFALQSGTLEEGVSKCVGTHWPTVTGSVVLLGDESQSISPFFYQALSNIWIGSTQTTLISVGNPMTPTDALANRAEPRAGWSSVTPDSDRWISKRGALVLHLNGEKSPAIAEPEKYPFLINAAAIRKVLSENFDNKDSMGYRSMVLGWFSDGDDTNVVLPLSMIHKHKAQDDVQWLDGIPEHVVAGFDPAGGGGDAAVLTVGYVGTFINGVRGMWLAPPIELRLDRNADLPIQYQVSEQIKAARLVHDFDIADLAVDESGLTNFSDVIEMESGSHGILRVSFGSRPSKEPVSVLDRTLKTEKYANMVTELWMDVAALVQFGQIRGMSDKAAYEYSIRQVLPRRPLRVESKLDLKKRLKASPDTADSTSLCLHAAIKRGYLMPGALVSAPQGFSIQRLVNDQRRQRRTVDGMEPDYSGNPLDI